MARPRMTARLEHRLVTWCRKVLHHLERRMGAGVALGLSLTLPLVLLAASGWALGSLARDVFGQGEVAYFDRPITAYVVDHRTAWLTSAMRAITSLGSTGVLFAVLLLGGSALALRRRSWEPLTLLGGALAGAVALDRTVKVLVRRARPTIGPVVAHAHGFSFPSGHATQSSATWGALALLVIPSLAKARDRYIVGGFTAILVVAVGMSRVYLGVHWMTDVLCGWALGAIWLAALTVVLGGRAETMRDEDRRRGE